MKKIFLFLIFSTTILFCYSQNKEILWDYPIKPSTNEWKSLDSSQEMIEACQIPTEILSNLSTARLADLCLNYPLLGDILSANNYQNGFDKLAKIFNGFQELFKRKDAGLALLNIYEKFDLNSFHKNKRIEFKNVFFDMCIDVVMAQPVFLESLNRDQEKKLMIESLNKLNIRQQIGDSFYRQKTTAVILSRLLTRNNAMLKEFGQSENDKFLLLNNYFILEDESIIEKIKQQAEKYLNDL
jgi:hypothetical protein